MPVPCGGREIRFRLPDHAGVLFLKIAVEIHPICSNQSKKRPKQGLGCSRNENDPKYTPKMAKWVYIIGKNLCRYTHCAFFLQNRASLDRSGVFREKKLCLLHPTLLKCYIMTSENETALPQKQKSLITGGRAPPTGSAVYYLEVYKCCCLTRKR